MRILRILGTIVKAALSIAAIIYMHPDSWISAIVIFAVVYGLITGYIFSFTHGSMFEGIGGGGIILALILNLCLPALVLVIPLFILEAVLPGEIGTIIYGVGVVIAGVGCVISDIMHMVYPDFAWGGDD